MFNTFIIQFDKLIHFVFDKLNPNISNSTDPRVPIVLAPDSGPKLLSAIEVPIEKKESIVWLSATIGTFVEDSINPSRLIFTILRGNPNTGNIVFSTADSGQGGPTYRTSTFTHVDQIKNYPSSKVTYYLTVQAVDNSSNINIVGPISFNGAEIKK